MIELKMVNFSVIYHAPDPVWQGHYKMRQGVRPSVRLSVACLDRNRERKGI